MNPFGYWREFQHEFPRLFLFFSGIIMVLLLLDIGLVYAGIQFEREFAGLRIEMAEADRLHADLLVADLQNRQALSIEMVRREALADPELNLAIDSVNGIMYLQREGARLREMPVRVGPEAVVGIAPDLARITPPLGKHLVALVIDEAFVWEIPDWVFLDRSLTAPADRNVAGGLGPIAIFLDDGSVIYTRPAAGPLADDNYIMPGAIRAEAADLQSIADDLNPGMAVYIY